MGDPVMRKIPSIPKQKIKNLVNFGDEVANWVNMDVGIAHPSKHFLKHQGFEIGYSVDYKSEETKEGRPVGAMPIRHMSIRCTSDGLAEDRIAEFVERTIKQFGFSCPKMTAGKKGRVHFHEYLFNAGF